MAITNPSALQSSLFFESPAEIYARVFHEIKPRTALPELQVEFCKFANADSSVKLENQRLRKELDVLRQEREILKKSLGILSSEQSQKGMP